MSAADSILAAQVRRDTWRRRHDRRNAGNRNTSMTVVQPPAQLAELLVRLSRGRISAKAAHDMVALGKGETTVEIVVDVETGSVEGWSMRTNYSPSGTDAACAPAVVTPAA